MRNLKNWIPQIKAYSKRHYYENKYKLNPKVIVLHYTATSSFPWNLVNSRSFAGERPGLSVHYVIKGNKIWQLLPESIRSRGCYGINHKAINIEMVALNSRDLYKKKETLNTCVELLRYLIAKYNIPLNKIYSHQMVGRMNPKITPEVKDYVNKRPYGKIDPGKKNMDYILFKLKK